ncbi:MAG TPA: hypothetical protein VF556_04505 [Pyrinomonadaceae bacterium]
MKVVLFLFITLLTFNVFAQTEPVQTVKPYVSVEKISLAKDEQGKAGEETEVFSTTDIPIHCVVYLDSVKPTLVKMNFIAVNVPGVKAETKVISVSYKTDGAQNQVNFTGKPDGFWIAGTYRIDIFVDGKAAGNKEFEIRKSSSEAQNPAPLAVKNFIPSKTKPKSPIRSKKD